MTKTLELCRKVILDYKNRRQVSSAAGGSVIVICLVFVICILSFQICFQHVTIKHATNLQHFAIHVFVRCPALQIWMW